MGLDDAISLMEKRAEQWKESQPNAGEPAGVKLDLDLQSLEATLGELFRAEKEILAKRQAIFSQITLVKERINNILNNKHYQRQKEATPVGKPSKRDREDWTELMVQWQLLSAEERQGILKEARVRKLGRSAR